jgi:hypothetical protein
MKLVTPVQRHGDGECNEQLAQLNLGVARPIDSDDVTTLEDLDL